MGALGVDHPNTLLGLRPGEAFSCIHACEGADGCGTGRHCTACGAVLSMETAREEGRQDVEECRLTINAQNGSSLDLEVVTTPLRLDGTDFYICALKDISAIKRRNILEQVFFHDVINTAGGIHGLATLLMEHRDIPEETEQEYKAWMFNLSSRLIEEIKQQRQLLAAERGEFTPNFHDFPVSRVLFEVYALYVNHDVAEGKRLMVSDAPELQIFSDEIIVRRILGNLVKNALEATSPGGTVTLACVDDGTAVTFSVHNEGVIPEEIQLQIFNRSFSTKSPAGRGIGTYSVRLFGEKYLHGKVAFTSTADAGTTFTFTLRSRKSPLA
jgi:signal transduction histidine kinase